MPKYNYVTPISMSIGLDGLVETCSAVGAKSPTFNSQVAKAHFSGAAVKDE